MARETVLDTVREQGWGTQEVIKFDNGYAGSVIRGKYTYGGPEGLYEVAVLTYEGEGVWGSDLFKLDYTTPITDDVIGYLEEDEVAVLLDRIEALPSRN